MRTVSNIRGEFNITTPELLEKGEHEVIVYAKRSESNSSSKAALVRFEVTDKGEIKKIETKPIGNIGSDDANGLMAGPPEMRESPESKSLPLLPILIAVVIIVAGVGTAVVMKKKQ